MSRAALDNKKTLGLPGMQEITELARLLRDSGDRVLSATSKLSLSTKLLHDLNEAFSLIINETDDLESSFQVCNSSRNEVFRDIKFLHDFVQKTIGLKIQYNFNDSKVDVDISKFRHLKYLELQKVPVESVKGIQGIRGQVECIICTGGRGVNNIHELLVACGGDAGVGFVWGSLRRLALPYNALTHLDKSLEYVPFLETIDLSHNAITKVTELEYIPNLRNVNLGYNNLEWVPQFSKTSYRTLQKLVLKNNYIDNIDGLDGLESLTELDLSHNCLTDHAVLWPLETMSMLVWVCLDGNPLAYHPRHRLHTIKHLHPSLSDSKFVLDEQPLSKSERLFVSENRVFSLRSTIRRRAADSTSSATSSMTSSWAQSSLPKSRSADAALVAEASIIETQPRPSAPRKRRNVREAVISEDELERERPRPSSLSSSYLESSTDHLETKRQILALRAKYGEENWLSSQTATHIHSIMGLEPLASPSNGLLSSTFLDNGRIDAPVNTQGAAGISPILTGSTNVEQRMTENGESLGQPCEETKEGVVKVEAKTELKRSDYESTDEGIVIETEPENEIEEQHVRPKPETQEPHEMSYDPEEEEGDLFLVQKKKGPDEFEMIFLIITPEDIKERDSLNGKIKYRWASNTVLSCILGRGVPATIDITFDTTRKDRMARTYLAELEDAKKISQILNDMIKTQPMMLKNFKCMKCSTHFLQDSDNNIVTAQNAGTTPKCPTCKSTLVIQTDDIPTPSAETSRFPEKTKLETTKELPNEAQLPHSSSQSSIGGTEGGAITIATSLAHCESRPQAQICCSATSLEESRESTPSAGTITRRYDSDIEILSNPSQSSIEVLDDGSKSTTPRRKRSSEERRVAVAPTLLTIPDTTLVMAGLTESSSSGSLTDSVCTAYENKAPSNKLPDKSELSNSRLAASDSETPEQTEPGYGTMTNLTSMLGELLQSMKIGTSRETAPRTEEGPEFIGSSVQYSYTDFSDLDHRIKLHIILNVFEHENEELALLLRGDMLTRASETTFPGCLVMSTAKLYLLRITGPEGEDPQRWLQKETSWTIDRLRSFAPLPFKQGVLVELHQPIKPGENVANNMVVCILQDFQRTSNFLFYLTDSPLPAGCEVEFTVPQHCTTSMREILKSAKSHRDEDAVRLLAIFSSAVLKISDEITKFKMSSLIITSSNLIVTQDRVNWLLPDNAKLPAIAAEQAMSNLIEVDFSGSQLTLSFLDEVAGAEASWQINLVSAGAAEAVINSIRPPWEELFSVPLQVNGPGAVVAAPTELAT